MQRKPALSVDGLLALSLSLEEAVHADDWDSVSHHLAARSDYITQLQADTSDPLVAWKLTAVRESEARLGHLISQKKAALIREAGRATATKKAVQAYLG